MNASGVPFEVRSIIVRIEGNVQGVGFRAWTERVAGQLCLAGWVRNRRDGSVEACLCGSPASVERAIERCRVGPRSGKVTRLTVTDEAAAAVEGFEIRPSL
jgi:acylphosphatase